MSLQFVLGPSGGGKSHYIYEKIIKESMDNPDINYILLVPEQYSLALQRKMVMLHPNGGTLNIDVIGFNRLAYRVFDELGVKTNKVLEDFGKSMLVRRVAGEVQNNLRVYKSCLNKNGFIDEVKSLMSEFYQYDFSIDELRQLIADIEAAGDETVLLDKLKDMETIITAFQEKIAAEYIVAEQLTELLSQCATKSELIKRSVIVMDGFTGFTPIQLKLIGNLINNAIKVYSVHTIDQESYKKTFKSRLAEHELFYLTDKTMESLKQLAKEKQVPHEPDICVGFDGPKRWSADKKDMLHLEKYIFRYPYKKYTGTVENISICAYQTPRCQLKGVCETIYSLVKEQGYRYKDIAIITGNFEKNVTAVTQLFPQYDIPYFLDYTPPVKNNSWVDCITHAIRIIEEDFSYDSVFSFLKSGVIGDISADDIDELENYVLAKGIKGYRRWTRDWKTATCDNAFVAKDSLLDIIKPFYKSVNKKKATVNDYTGAIRQLMDVLNFETGLEDIKGLYGRLLDIFDKLDSIMGDDCLNIREFKDILDVGLKELNLGMVPSKLDMVLVGDITRTRLDNIKVLFIIDANEGIIPSNPSSAGIISEKEKERLLKWGVELAPTDKINSFVEQMYLYSNMTAPSEKLYISYTNMSSDNAAMSPSYIIGRICNLFESMTVTSAKNTLVTTIKGTREKLVEGIWNIASGIEENIPTIGALCKAYAETGYEEQLQAISHALSYKNVPDKLDANVRELLKLRMMKQSISKLEQYASCGYSYFLKYTLGLREREVYQVESRETGNILHTAMEGMFRHVHDNMNNDWFSISPEDKDKMVEEHVNMAWDKELGDRELEGGRYEFLKESLYRIGKRTIRTLSDINSRDTLKPEFFEYRFKENMDINDNDSMTITGVVDRADAQYMSQDDKLRLKVIDYKSGNQHFELNKLYAGLQLQLAIYTNIMIELAGTKGMLNGVTEHTSVSPDGMYYYSMKDPYIEVKDESELDKKRAKELTLVGLDNDGQGDFDAILQYADKKAKDLAREIMDGNINKNPLFEGERTSCTYCPYSDCCRFDVRYGGNSYKYLKYKSTKKEMPVICDAIKEELGLNDQPKEEASMAIEIDVEIERKKENDVAKEVATEHGDN